MRDALAFIIMFFLIIIIVIATSEDKQEGSFAETLCANITCYYEIKDK